MHEQPQIIEIPLNTNLSIASSSPRSPLVAYLFEEVDSTNRVLWQLAANGAGEGTVAIAQQQTSGRGQWGRQWQSTAGGLYLSTLLTPKLAANLGGQLTLCTSWGIAEALQQSGVPVRLKWPNDLVCAGKKLGGILTETRLSHGCIAQAVVGVGMNWSNAVPEAGITLEFLRQTQPDVAIASLEELRSLVLSGLFAGYDYWQEHGIDAVLPRYESLLTGLGQTIVTEEGEGIIVGVSALGHLCVQVQVNGSPVERSLPPGTVRLGYGA